MDHTLEAVSGNRTKPKAFRRSAQCTLRWRVGPLKGVDTWWAAERMSNRRKGRALRVK